MTCHDIVFGDGMREIRPVMDGFYELDVFPVERRKIVVRKRKRRKQALSVREAIVICSCYGPLIFGLIFGTLMVRHTALYMIYWTIAILWNALVLYANKKERRPIGKRQHSGNHKLIVAQIGRLINV